MAVFIKYFMIVCFCYVVIRIAVPYLVLFMRFMFNEPFKWDKYVEKPRLVFYAIGLINMQLGYEAILDYPEKYATFYLATGSFLLLGGMFMTQVTWTKRFKKVFIPKIKQKLKSSRNFNISITESQLGKLYDNMVRYDMVIIDKTSKDDFIQCFLKDWDEHETKVHLKLKNPACREFYELFKNTFPKNDLQLIDFVKNSDMLRREDGQPYNYDTVRNALTRNRVSKKSEELEAVFNSFS